ncbi:Uncharacterised protein [Mycobacterium tuberculosis]|nr:Uncharacterised protein [Mycobacterium tuberculosis]
MLERLPRGLQDEPLLRVHREGLARGDAEERGVEARRVRDETAAFGELAAELAGREAVDAVEPPAAVRGERGDAVPGVDDQVPELLRGGDAAGVPAGHADDRDRLVGHRGGAHRARPVVAEQLPQQVAGDVLGRRVVEHERGGQPEAERGTQAVAQLDRGQRVEAHLVERALGVDGVGGRVPEHHRGLRADDLQQGRPLLLAGLAGEPGGLRRAAVAGRVGGGPRRDAHQRAQQCGHRAGGRGRLDGGDLQPGRDEHRAGGVPGADGGVEQGEAVGRGQGAGARARHARQVGVAQLRGHPRRLGPQAPGEGDGGQAGAAPVRGESVEEGVARGVVGLPGAAEDAGGAGEEHEGAQRQAGGELVQVPCAEGLRGDHAVEPLVGHGGDDTVVDDRCRVHDGAQRPVGRDGGEQGGQRGAVGDVAGHGLGGGAEAGELGEQRVDPRGALAGPGGQQQVPDALGGGEVAGDERAEPAGAAGDQDGAGRIPGRGSAGLGRAGVRHGRGGRQVAGAGEPGGVRPPGAEGELRLLALGGAQERGPGLGVLVEVGDQEAVRVLGLRGAHQPPDGGRAQVAHRVAVLGRDTAAGDDDQPGAGGALGVVRPGAHGGQRRRQRAGDVRIARRGGDGEQDAVRLVDGGRFEARGGEGFAGRRVGGGRSALRHGPAAGRVLRARLGKRRPVGDEQRVVLRAAAQGPELRGGHGAGPHGVRGEYGRALGVGGQQREGLALGPQPHPERGRSGGVQPQVPQGAEGLRARAAGRIGGGERGQGGLEQRRVQAVTGGLRGRRLGQGGLGVQFGAVAPQPGQGAQRRTVGDARAGQPLVEGFDGHRLGPGGRPGAGPLVPARDGAGRCRGLEDTGGVLGPAFSTRLGVVRGGVDAQRPAAVLTCRADGHLEGHAAGLGHRYRCVQVQGAQPAAAHLVARPDGEFHQHRLGQQHHSAEHAVGQPGLLGGGEPSGEHDAAAAGERHGRAEQRVRGGAEARGGHVPGRAVAALQPVAGVFEGVGRQVDTATGGRAAVHGAPVDRLPGGVERGRGVHEHRFLGPVAAGHRDHRAPLGGLRRQRTGDHGGEHAIGADVHEHGRVLRGGPGHAVGEAHRAAGVLDPVPRVGAQRATVAAGEVGDEAGARLPARNRGEDVAEAVEHPVHVRGVEGVRDAQHANLAALGAPLPGEGLDGVRVAGDDDRGRAVHGRDLHPSFEPRDALRDLLLGAGDGQHGAAGAGLLHEPAAGGDDLAGRGQIPHPRQVRGGQLADGVAAEQVGAQPPGLQLPVPGHLDGEQRGLGELGAGEAVRVTEDRRQRLAEQRFERGADRVERLGELGQHTVQAQPHLSTL